MTEQNKAMAGATCSIKKSPIPLVWLDTSVLLRFSRLKSGKIGRDKQAAEIDKLYHRLISLSNQGRILCLNANQTSEVLGFGANENFSRMFVPLTLGIRANRPAQVRFKQECAGLLAYLHGNDVVELQYTQLVPGNISENVREALSSHFFVHIPDRDVTKRIVEIKKFRRRTMVELELLRQRCVSKVNYRQQLEIELYGDLPARFESAARFYRDSWSLGDFSWADLDNAMELVGLIEMWRSVIGAAPAPSEFNLFFSSAQRMALPSIRVWAEMMSKLLTSNRPIQHGDAIDIENIATVLPYVDLLVVDKPMKSFSEQLRLGPRYNTMVAYIGDVEAIGEFLESCDNVGRSLVSAHAVGSR